MFLTLQGRDSGTTTGNVVMAYVYFVP